MVAFCSDAMTLSVAKVMQRRIIERLTNNKLENRCKEEVLAKFKVLFRHLTGRTRLK